MCEFGDSVNVDVAFGQDDIVSGCLCGDGSDLAGPCGADEVFAQKWP
jgi:hypothetical protein